MWWAETVNGKLALVSGNVCTILTIYRVQFSISSANHVSSKSHPYHINNSSVRHLHTYRYTYVDKYPSVSIRKYIYHIVHMYGIYFYVLQMDI